MIVRRQSTLSRAWDGYDAYLFDIDGTLLHCRDAVHYFAFCRVLSNVAGRPLNLDGVSVHGNIDPGIIRDAMLHAKVPEANWRPLLPQMLAALAADVEQHRDELQIEILPGVPDVLRHLRSVGAALGVATGNLQRIGWAKLAHCGLREYFSFGGFSDSHEYRGAMIAAAAQLARSLTRPDAAVCVIGDTPADIAAAREAGVDVIAVATGIYKADQLQAADLVVEDLSELCRIRSAPQA